MSRRSEKSRQSSSSALRNSQSSDHAASPETEVVRMAKKEVELKKIIDAIRNEKIILDGTSFTLDRARRAWESLGRFDLINDLDDPEWRKSSEVNPWPGSELRLESRERAWTDVRAKSRFSHSIRRSFRRGRVS